MSLARQGEGGGVSSGALGGLGVVGCRSLSSAGSPLGVSCPFSLATSAELQPHVHLWAGSCRCNRSVSGEGSNQACASLSGLLLPSFCHSQGHRWVAPCDIPLATQQLGGRLPFPYGDYPVCSPISPSRGLDGIPGSPGCLPPGSGPSIVSTLPEVLRGGVSSVPSAWTCRWLRRRLCASWPRSLR